MLLVSLYQATITAVLVGLFVNTTNNLRLLRTSNPPALIGEAGPLVSILVPARNEARSIAACVEALARQDYSRCEILVLDDQSEDDTAAIVAELARRYGNVRLLRGRPLPDGWHGKAFACAQLGRAASGDWLLFVDADTRLEPQCVRIALYQAQQRRADLLTMMPRILAGTLGEALLLPIIPLTFVAFLPLGLVSDHPSPLFAGALGPFLLFRRDMYLQIGGHASVRTDIVEDMQLSRLVKRHRGRVVWIDGTSLMSVRFYHGFAEAWRGLAKSAFAAIDYSLPGLLLGIPLCIAVFFGPYFLLLAGLLRGPIWLSWVAGLQIALLWTSQLLLTRRFHLPPVTLLLQAGTILAIFGTTLYSAVQTELGQGVEWKGRTYQFDGLRRDTAPSWTSGLALMRLLAAALLIAVRLAYSTGRPGGSPCAARLDSRRDREPSEQAHLRLGYRGRCGFRLWQPRLLTAERAACRLVGAALSTGRLGLRTLVHRPGGRRRRLGLVRRDGAHCGANICTQHGAAGMVRSACRRRVPARLSRR